MSMQWIRKNYGVPAKRGGKVVYTGEKEPQKGVITSASGGYLRIRLEGQKESGYFHPTWELEYLGEKPNE